MIKWIGQCYVAMLKQATFYWCILFFYIVGAYGGKGRWESLGFSIGVSLVFVTFAIFIKWVESKQKIKE